MTRIRISVSTYIHIVHVCAYVPTYVFMYVWMDVFLPRPLSEIYMSYCTYICIYNSRYPSLCTNQTKLAFFIFQWIFFIFRLTWDNVLVYSSTEFQRPILNGGGVTASSICTLCPFWKKVGLRKFQPRSRFGLCKHDFQVMPILHFPTELFSFSLCHKTMCWSIGLPKVKALSGMMAEKQHPQYATYARFGRKLDLENFSPGRDSASTTMTYKSCRFFSFQCNFLIFTLS